jgi:hypothetical protein
MTTYQPQRVGFKKVLFALLLLAPFAMFGQSIITLNQLETGNQEHCAGLMIHLQPGYSYTATATESMHSYISYSCADNLFYTLKKKLDGGIYRVPKHNIYLKYREEYNTQEFKFSIYNFDNSVLFTQNEISINTTTDYGDNRIVIPLDGVGASLPSGYYTLEVVNDKNEKWYLRFKY